MVAVSDFSGLMSSAWALAKAEASAATVSLDRGMCGLRLQHIKAHRARFGALCSHAVADGLPGILRHQGFELAFGSFVVEKGAPGVAEERGELGPGIRCAHIDDADGLDARPRRLGIDEMGRFAGLDAAPELLFRRRTIILTSELGSRLIKSTIQEQRRGKQRPGNFAPACRSGLRCA